MRSTPDAVKFNQAIGALQVCLGARRKACEAERERLRTIRNQRLDRLKDRSLAS